MPHIRKQIRDRIIQNLTPLMPSVIKALEGEPVYPADRKTFPAVSLLYGQGTVGKATSRGDSVPRAFQFHIDIYVEGSPLQDQADDVALAVEMALANYRTLNGLAQRADFTGDVWDTSGEGEKRLGRLRLTYIVQTSTTETDPANRD